MHSCRHWRSPRVSRESSPPRACCRCTFVHRSMHAACISAVRACVRRETREPEVSGTYYFSNLLRFFFLSPLSRGEFAAREFISRESDNPVLIPSNTNLGTRVKIDSRCPFKSIRVFSIRKREGKLHHSVAASGDFAIKMIDRERTSSGTRSIPS